MKMSFCEFMARLAVPNGKWHELNCEFLHKTMRSIEGEGWLRVLWWYAWMGGSGYIEHLDCED